MTIHPSFTTLQGTTSDFGNINNNLWYSTVIGGSIKLITLCSYAPFEPGVSPAAL